MHLACGPTGTEHHAASCGAIAAAGGVPALVALLSSGNDQLRLHAATMLQALAFRSPEHSTAIAAAGAIPPLVRALAASNMHDLRGASAGALATLALGSAERSAQALAAGALLPLLQLARTGEGPRMLFTACGALGSMMASSPACRHVICQAGGVAVLQAVRRRSSDALVQEMAARVLAVLPSQPQQASPPPADAPSTSAAAAAQPTVAAAPPPRPPAPRVCANPACGATTGLRRCGGCAAVRYCSEACSKAHWRAHKAECRRLVAEREAASTSGGASGSGAARP